MDRLVLKGSSRSCCQCLEKRKASANQVSLLERMMLCICVFPCIYELYKMWKGTFHRPCGPVVPKCSTWQTPKSHGWHPTFIPHFRDHHFGGPGIAPETFQHRWLKPSHIISAVLTQCITRSKLEKVKKKCRHFGKYLLTCTDRTLGPGRHSSGPGAWRRRHCRSSASKSPLDWYGVLMSGGSRPNNTVLAYLPGKCLWLSFHFLTTGRQSC